MYSVTFTPIHIRKTSHSSSVSLSPGRCLWCLWLCKIRLWVSLALEVLLYLWTFVFDVFLNPADVFVKGFIFHVFVIFILKLNGYIFGLSPYNRVGTFIVLVAVIAVKRCNGGEGRCRLSSRNLFKFIGTPMSCDQVEILTWKLNVEHSFLPPHQWVGFLLFQCPLHDITTRVVTPTRYLKPAS